jgi:hypothetical protein
VCNVESIFKLTVVVFPLFPKDDDIPPNIVNNPLIFVIPFTFVNGELIVFETIFVSVEEFNISVLFPSPSIFNISIEF